MVEVNTEQFDGSDCSGSDGAAARTLTLTNTALTQQDGFLVSVAGLNLSLTDEYTISHNSTATVITFVNAVYDDSLIVVNYFQALEGSGTGTTGNDFDNGPLDGLGVTVVRTPVTVTTDFSGNKTYTDGSTNDVTAVFSNPSKKYMLDKAGLTEAFDAQLFVTDSETITKYDKITYNSNTYRVDNVTLKKFGSTSMFKKVGLFFIE